MRITTLNQNNNAPFGAFYFTHNTLVGDVVLVYLLDCFRCVVFMVRIDRTVQITEIVCGGIYCATCEQHQDYQQDYS